MSERKLVTIRKVSDIQPIHGADKIVVATVDGWQCVVGKDEFQVGDYGVYFEIDSLLPENDPRYAFMAKGNKVREMVIAEKKMVHTVDCGVCGDDCDNEVEELKTYRGYKLKTIRLRGQLSQGLLKPVADFPEIIIPKGEGGLVGVNVLGLIAKSFDYSDLYGTDLSDRLGVVKYEAPIPAQLQGKVEGMFPGFIKKTDEERCQNLDRSIFEYHLNDRYEVSVKLDGSSMTVYYRDGKIGVCSRNLELKEEAITNGKWDNENTLWRLAKETKLVEALKLLGLNIAVQGEIIGPTIQGNNEKLNAPEFRVFNVWDISAQKYAGYNDRVNYYIDGLTRFGATILQVPILHTDVTLEEIGIHNIKELLEYADGPSLNQDRRREGLVFKNNTGDFSFKAISNKYLLDIGE